LVRWRSGSLGAALGAAMEQARGDTVVCLPLGTAAPAEFGTLLAAEFEAQSRCGALLSVVAEQRCDRVRRTVARLVREGERDVVREDDRGASLCEAKHEGKEQSAPEGAGLFALALRRSAIGAVNGLARDLSSELLLGLDVCRRLSAAGYALRLLPQLVWRLPPDFTPLDEEQISRVGSGSASLS